MRLFSEHKGCWVLLALTFIGHAPLMFVPPLNSDEAFIWDWSRHLALGYYSHPPLAAWVLAAVTAVLGTTAYTVRLGALLLHLGTAALLYRCALELAPGRRMALVAMGLYVGMPVSLFLGTMVSSDMGLLFCWMATAWFTKRAVVDGERRLWYAAGVSAGGMLLSKFFAVLFFPALLLLLLLHPAYRRELARKEPWLAAVVALLVFSPFLYWNATHGWLTFQFNLVNRQGATQFDPLKPLLYVAGQAFASSPVVLVAMLIAVVAVLSAGWQRLRRPRPRWLAEDAAPAARRADALLYYALLTAVPLAIFAGVSLAAKVGAHWTAAAMPTGALVLSAWLHGLAGRPGPAGAAGEERRPERLLRPRTAWACGASLVAVSLPIFVLVLFPRLLPDRLVTYDEAHERTPDGAKYWGYEEVGQRIAALRREYGQLPGGLFISTRDYSDAALLDFYTPGFGDTVLMGYRATEFHGRDFLYWDDAIKRRGANSIFVLDAPIFPNALDRIEPHFRSVEPLETLVVRDARGTVLRKWFFALGRDYLDNEPEVLSR